MPFDDPVEVVEYRDFMTDFYTRVYADQADLFFEKCLFVVDADDTPIATAFVWQSFGGQINTFHWLKVLKKYEDKGVGRALVSFVMERLKPEDYPVFLHTQPGSFRAIKLYSDFGFTLLSDKVIGYRNNDLEQCLPVLAQFMKGEEFSKLQISKAPAHFLQIVKTVEDDQF